MNLYKDIVNNLKEADIDHFIERGNVFIPVRVGETDEEVLAHLEALGNLKDVTPTQEQIDSGEYISELVHHNNDPKSPLCWPEWRRNPNYVKPEEVKEGEERYTGNSHADEVVFDFEQAEKTMETYQKALNEISRMEWDNDISREKYEECIKKIQDIYNSRNK